MKKITAAIACLTLFLQLVTGCLPFAALADGAGSDNTLYVAVNGNDAWRGTVDKPLRTVEAARKLIEREKIKNATVFFREGSYYFDRTIGFSSEDNGTTYSAYKDEKVVFSGGYTVDNWKTEYLNGRAVWTSDIDITRLNGDLCTLYGQNGLLPNARLPETGYYYTAGGADQNNAFIYEDADVSDYIDCPDIHVRLFHLWVDEYLNVTGIDTVNKKVSVDRSCGHAISAGDAYYFENVREALDKPGEWYIDRSIGKLYYMPYENETIDSAQVRVGAVEKLMDISACSGLSFRGITFTDTNWTDNGSPGSQANNSEKPCIEIHNADNVSFTGCTFENIGESCLRFSDGSAFCTVSGCEFKNIGAHAVYISGPNRENGITHDITVTDNHIFNYGLMRPMSVAVFQTYARNSTISHNEIHHGAYSAVSLGWTWGYESTVNNHNTVSDNLIYDIGHSALSDLGGIYLLGVSDGTVVSGNVIFDVAAGPDASTYGGWGIYLDEGSKGVTVTNNLVYDCDSQGFHQHYGQENLVKNNIFAFNNDAQVRSSRSTTTQELGGAAPKTELYLKNNILVGDGQMMYQRAAKNRFADDCNLYYDYLYSVAQSGEVYSSTDDNATIKGTADIRALGYYKNGVFTDPRFVDPENRNFTFADTSAASRISFVPYDYFAYNVGSVTYKSKYLVNLLDREKSSCEPEKWADYQIAKQNAVADRNNQTMAALERAYNSLADSQPTQAELITVTNTADWLMRGQVRLTNLCKWKTATYAQAKTTLFVSGVSGGTDLSDPTDAAFASAYPIESIDTKVNVDARSKTEAANATVYVDRSLYSDLSETDLRFGGGFDSATGQGIRYYCALQEVGTTAPTYDPAESVVVKGKTYSIKHGLRSTPLAGKPDGYDAKISAIGKPTVGRLYGPVPDKGESVDLRIAGIALVHRTTDCKILKQKPASYYYYCVNSYIDLTVVGVDKGKLRDAYHAALAHGRSDAAVDNALSVLNSVSASQAEIDAAVNAIAANTDKAALINALAITPAFSGAEYTAETWKLYAEAMENGRAVFNDPFASQAEIDAATANIKNSYSGLTDCRKLIDKLSSLAPLQQKDYSQYVWYEFGSALEDLRAGLVSSSPKEQERLIDEYNSKCDELRKHLNDTVTVQYKLSQHKYNNALTNSTFYAEGVAGGESVDTAFDFDKGNYDGLLYVEPFNLTVASNNKSASATVYVDRSVISDLSQTPLRVGVDIDYIAAGSMRVYLMFANDYAPVYANCDSVTVNGKTYTLGIGTYDDPIIGGADGSNTDIKTQPTKNVKGRSGMIYGPIPEAGEKVSFRLAACIFNQNFSRTAYFCGNSFIDFTVFGVDKSQLRDFAFNIYASAPNGCDTSSPEYAEYRAALSEALTVIYHDTYAQDAVEAAAERLKLAYDAVEAAAEELKLTCEAADISTPDYPDDPDELPEEKPTLVERIVEIIEDICNFAKRVLLHIRFHSGQ